MEIQLLEKNKDQDTVSFILKNADVSFANALRRIMIAEVPTMAIEEIEFRANDSILYDEVLSHRLGLVVLSTDLKSYELPTSNEDIEQKKAKNVALLTLKEKGPKTVYASDLKSNDPKIKPVYPKTLLVKLLKGQELELEAVAILGKGKQHMKWSAGHVYYKYKAKVTVGEMTDEFREKYPKQIFDKSGKIDKNAIIDLDLVDACDGINEDIIKVEYDEKSLIFNIESWGQLDYKEIALKSVEILEQKCEEIEEKLKDLK